MDRKSGRSRAQSGTGRGREDSPEAMAAAVRDRIRERLRTLPLDATDEALDLLQDGYAHALTLEGACRRIERELADLRAGASDPAAERELSGRLRTMRGTLRELRSALATLRAWAEEHAG